MTVHICMTPSNTLSSTNASRFALKIIEGPIVIDYLAVTHGVPEMLVAQVPGNEDWWDTVDKASYVGMLKGRHRKLAYDRLMADKWLRWPDISTFNGPSVLRFAYGDVMMRPPVDAPRRRPGRSEIYEIKPNNPRGKTSALKKLDDVEGSYRTYGISGIYSRGQAYPASLTGQRTISLQTPHFALFSYLVKLGLKTFGIRVSRVSIEVTRVEAGALLYKICVDLVNADAYQKDSQWIMANFVVRMLWLAHHSRETPAVRSAAAQFVENMEPEDAGIDPRKVERVIAGRDLSRPPMLKLLPLSIAPELAGSMNAIRHAMYSRLMGEPEERYFLCADKAWYQANVEFPGRAKVEAQLRLLRLDATRPFVQRSGFLGLTQPVVMTADRALGELPVVGPAYRWMVDHPAEALLIIGCYIVVTAAVLATAGAAAPAGAQVTSMAVAAAAGPAAAGGEMTGGIMLAAGASETVIPAAVGAIETGGAGARAGLSIVNWARAAAQAGATEAELAAAAEAASGDSFVIRLLSEPAIKAALQVAAKTAPVVAGAAVIGFSARPAYAYAGPPSGAVSAAGLGELRHLDVGHLHLIRVSKAVRTQLPAVPELHKEFEIGDYLPSPERKNTATFYMMGAFDIA